MLCLSNAIPVSGIDGLPTKAIGISGVTQCSNSSNMPSTDIWANYAFITFKDTIYSFGGRIGRTPEGSTVAYKYNVATDAWFSISSLNHRRYIAVATALSENEILISGISLLYGNLKSN